jgi:predicted amidohydrolase YtcJ
LIRGATVHTAGEQGVLSNADVLVRDGKIAAVGTALSAPSGVTTVDAKGRALTPGLFGGLTAIGIEEVSLEPTTVDSAVLLNAGDPRNALADCAGRAPAPAPGRA